MKLFEIKDAADDLTTKLVKLLSDVTFVNTDRQLAMSKLFFLLKENKFPFKLANKKYKIGRVIPIHKFDIEKIKQGKYTIPFYSNMVIPHFIIESNPEEQVEKLIRAGIGGIVNYGEDVEVRDSYNVIAYKVPDTLIDLQLSITDVLENLDLVDKHKNLYLKASKEKEILTINKENHKYQVKDSDIICFGYKSSGYIKVSKSIDIL